MYMYYLDGNKYKLVIKEDWQNCLAIYFSFSQRLVTENLLCKSTLCNEGQWDTCQFESGAGLQLLLN